MSPRIPALSPLLALAGCLGATEPSSEALDRGRYTASTRAMGTDPAEAARLCLDIGDDVLQGECITLAAKEMAGKRLDALPLCDQVRHPGWAQVCTFEVADGAGLIGDEAIAACQRSGEFIERCLSHALSRHADRDWRTLDAGQEGAFLAWMDEQIPHYGLEQGFQDTRRDFLARRISERVRREAPGGQPRSFSMADCGEAPADTCAEVYRYLVRGSARAMDVSTLCAAPITDAALQGAGLPVWTDGEPAVVADLWGRLCRELQGPGRPPPHLPPK